MTANANDSKGRDTYYLYHQHGFLQFRIIFLNISPYRGLSILTLRKDVIRGKVYASSDSWN